VHGPEVFHVKTVRHQHEPGAIGNESERSTGDKLFRPRIEEKRQGKQGLWPVKEKNVSVPLNDGITPQPCKCGDPVLAGNADAAAVGPILPMVKWALERFANYTTLA
jgi:stalled ribosome alternative rescue factor ArfA